MRKISLLLSVLLLLGATQSFGQSIDGLQKTNDVVQSKSVDKTTTPKIVYPESEKSSKAVILSESFENYSDFALDNFGDWTFYDGDETATWGMSGVEFPNSGYTGSWLVFNPYETTPPLSDPEGVETGAGDPLPDNNKYAVSIAANGAVNDDWMISPQLSVNADLELNFWAKSYTADYGLDRLKIMLSTSTNDPFDFIQVWPATGDYEGIPAAQWNEYNVDLSAYTGDIYLAFVCVTDDAFILMLDEIEIRGDGMVSVPDDDFAVTEMTATPSIMFPEYTQDVEFVVRNAGATVQSKAVTLTARDDDDAFAEDIILLEGETDELEYGDTQTFSAEFVPPYAGNWVLYASVPADEDATNDGISKNIKVYRVGELVESFEGSLELPEGWMTDEAGWEVIDAGFAQEGGKVAMYGIPGGYTDVMLMSPMVTVGEETSLEFYVADLNSKAGFENDFGYGSLQVKYSTDGTTWTDIGALIEFSDYEPRVFQHQEIDLSSLDAGNYFIGFFASSTFNYEDFASVVYLDLVGGPDAILPTSDAALMSIAYPKAFYYENSPVAITSNIKNNGLNTLEEVAYSVLIDDGEVASSSVVDLLYQQTKQDMVTINAPVEGVYALSVALADDDDLDNNTKNMELTVLNSFQLAEDFTGASLDNWTFDPLSDADGWTTTSQSGAAGSVAAFVSQPDGYADLRLITPLVTVSADYNELHFNLASLNNAFGFENGHGFSTLQIEYSTDGTTWTAIGDPITLNDVGNGVWTKQMVDVSSLADGDYHFAFNASSTFVYVEEGTSYGAGFYLDMVYGPIFAGDAVVLGVQSLEDILVEEGTLEAELVLPTSVNVNWTAGQMSLGVENWTCVTDGGYDETVIGEYVFEGDLVLVDGVTNPDDLKASVKVIVGEADDDDDETSIEENHSDMFRMYPNPSNNGLVNIELDNISQVNVRVFDMTGRLVTSTLVEGNSKTIDLSNQSAGMYIVQIIHNGEVASKKLIIR